MDFDYTAEENAFREEVRNFISENLPPKKDRDKNFLNTWLEKVRAKGWVGFSRPKEFGGSAGGLIEQTILREEMALAKAPPLGTSMMGLAWVGPALWNTAPKSKNVSSFRTSSTARSLGVQATPNPITALILRLFNAKQNCMATTMW